MASGRSKAKRQHSRYKRVLYRSLFRATKDHARLHSLVRDFAAHMHTVRIQIKTQIKL